MEMLEVVLAEEGSLRRPRQVSERHQGGAGGAMAGPMLQGRAVPGRNQDSARRAFNRAMKDLIALRRIGIWDELVWIVPQ